MNSRISSRNVAITSHKLTNVTSDAECHFSHDVNIGMLTSRECPRGESNRLPLLRRAA
jgi:hypothetical protein